MKRGVLRLGVDIDNGLISEWMQTCGEEKGKALIVHWEPFNAIVNKGRPANLPNANSRRLRQSGFGDAVDKLVLRLGCLVRDKIVVSDDGDFWDPLAMANKGNSKAIVAQICRDDLGVTIVLLGNLVANLAQ